MVSFKLENLNDVNKLVNLCQKYSCDIDVSCGRYVVDGKSVMGVSSLIGNEVNVTIHSVTTEDKIEFEKKILKKLL